MSLPRRVRRRPVPAVLATVLATVLAAVPVLALAPAAPAQTPPTAGRAGHGSAGIGDPYFPLDGNGGLDVRHYDVHVAYDFDTGRLSGWTALRIRATRSLDRFDLDFLLPVSRVVVAGRPAAYTRPHHRELQVTPRRPIRSGSSFTVRVAYAGRPGEESLATALGHEHNWLASRQEVVTVNEPHMAGWWFPSNDHPRDKARYDVHVTVPRGKVVVGNGVRVSRRVHGDTATTHWRESTPMATYLAFFAAGPFQVEHGSRDGLPWLVAVSRGLSDHDRRASLRQLRSSSRITAWLADQFGPYPFDSTGGVVTALDPGFALENQTRPVYPALPADASDLLVHELAHQWFGDSVSVDRWRDVWLNEGFATYAEALWSQAHGGPTTDAFLRTSYHAWVGNSWFWRLRVDAPGAAHLFDYQVYQRGAMTLAALRNRIGADATATLLRRWAAERRGGTGRTGQFTALAEEVSGQDLDGFFAAWLRGTRAPARTAENGLG